MTAQRRRSILDEPRPIGAPPRSRRDWLLVAALETVVVLETLLRPNLTWRPFVGVVALAVMPLLLWRRSHPLHCVVLGFGTGFVLAVIQLIGHTGDLGLFAMTTIVVLLYSLVRWGSGREVVLGGLVVLAALVAGMAASSKGWSDVFGGTVFLLGIATLGAMFRYRADVTLRQLAEIRNEERARLARELHDTVAHHVSAIAVQAQAGRAVAGTRPDAAVATLAVIEGEASKTLEEMRAMVRVLRGDEPAALAPHEGIAALRALARRDERIEVVVSTSGDVDDLPPAIDSTLYRLVREALTNTARHASGATRVDVRVTRVGDEIRLAVTDDGHLDPNRPVASGFGLLGMAERAALLGGTLHAGPRVDGGWSVDAVLPLAARP